MISKMSRTISGARPRLGSSSISRRGRPISARPMASICRSPPESVPASWRRRSCEPGEAREHLRQGLRALGGRGAEAAEQQVVLHRHGAEQLAPLRHQRQAHRHALLDGVAVERGAVERHARRCDGQQAHHRVEQRGLAGAVGADHGDDAARLHG